MIIILKPCQQNENINKICIILQLNGTVIKNWHFNGFQWGHFCPKGPERNFFLYLWQNRFIKGNGNSKITIKIHTCAKMYAVANTTGKIIKKLKNE